jgi:hypothetical protein
MSAANLRLGRKSALTLVLSLLLGLILSGCGGTIEPEGSWRPFFLPCEISVGYDGKSTISGSVSCATDIGEFSIGAKYVLPQQSSSSIYVILRDRRTGFDHVYAVHTQGGGEFNAVVNGTTSITVTNDQVLIDITDGTIRQIRFKEVQNPIAEGSSSGNWWEQHVAARWDAGWAQSWYKPYALAKWAYDDSTIEKWFGIGFIWFLLRLVLSIALALVDTVLTMGFFIGQFAFIIFGPTGRDVIYGFMILGVLILVIAGLADA